ARETTLALGHVEDEVGTRERQFLGKEGVGFEASDATEETKGLLHRADGGCVVPLGVLIGRGGGVEFLVVCETYSHSDIRIGTANKMRNRRKQKKFVERRRQRT